MSLISVGAANAVPIQQLEVKVKWDEKSGHGRIDVDLAVVLFNSMGQMLDIACFNQTRIANNAVVHSGDHRDGHQKGTDESAEISLQLMPPAVQYVLIVATIASEKHALHDFEKFSLKIEPLQGAKANFLESYDRSARSFVPFALVRTPQRFDFINVAHWSPNYGLENIWTMCDQVLEKLVDPVMWRERPQAKYDLSKLKKGQEFILPHPKNIVRVALGWNCGRDGVDLDAFCYQMINDSRAGGLRIHETVFYNHLHSNDGSVKHSGDNRTGAGDGDDETIRVNLDKVDKNVVALVFVVKIYDNQRRGITFDDVEHEYIRIIDVEGKQVARYNLDSDASFNTKNCGIFCVLRRIGHSWRVEPMSVAADTAEFDSKLPKLIEKTF